jgi:hypothetical protein
MKVKNHLQNASNMSLSDIVGGTTKLIGNSVSLSFKGLGAAVYVANQAVSAGLKVGKAAFDEVHEGYTQTDDILSSKPKPQATRRPQPAEREPQQTEFDFD